MSRTKRRLALGLLFAGLCVLALVGVVAQALGRGQNAPRHRLAV